MTKATDEPELAGVERPEGIAPDALVRVFRVAPEQAGMRLDVFLRSQLRNTSRTRAQTIIQRCAFSPSGRPLRANDRVRAEDRVVLWRAPFEEDDDADVEIPIIHEDEHLLVVNKPPLVTVHPTARHHHRTVLKRLQVTYPGEPLSLIHRLDRETSGVLLVARSLAADRAFKRNMEDASVQAAAAVAVGAPTTARKHYLAITWGIPSSGLVELPLEPDIDNPLRVKMRVAQVGAGMPARTSVEVLETRGKYALVRCGLHTGRQHQVRVHLACQGCPVVGDKLYGPDDRMLARAADHELTEEDLTRLELPRHALHAERHTLVHGLTGEPLDLCAPLPEDLRTFWSATHA